MNINVKTKIGDTVYEFLIEESKDLEALHKAIVLGNPPKYCSECKNASGFRMDSNKDKDGNIYVNVVCEKCYAKAKLGLYKSGGYFWHKFKLYVKDGAEAAADKVVPPIQEPEKDDLPF